MASVNDFDRHDLSILVEAVEDAQAILAQAIAPGGITDHAAVLRILSVLDHEHVVRAARALRHRMSLQVVKAPQPFPSSKPSSCLA